MAKIIKFPKIPKGRSEQAHRPPIGGIENPWSEVWNNPLVQILYRLFVALVAAAWPILRWFLVADICIQLLRVVFLGGFAALGALLHLLVLCAIAYCVTRVPSQPPFN